jgi:hypothetical protein
MHVTSDEGRMHRHSAYLPRGVPRPRRLRSTRRLPPTFSVPTETVRCEARARLRRRRSPARELPPALPPYGFRRRVTPTPASGVSLRSAAIGSTIAGCGLRSPRRIPGAGISQSRKVVRPPRTDALLRRPYGVSLLDTTTGKGFITRATGEDGRQRQSAQAESADSRC